MNSLTLKRQKTIALKVLIIKNKYKKYKCIIDIQFRGEVILNVP